MVNVLPLSNTFLLTHIPPHEYTILWQQGFSDGHNPVIVTLVELIDSELLRRMYSLDKCIEYLWIVAKLKFEALTNGVRLVKIIVVDSL